MTKRLYVTCTGVYISAPDTAYKRPYAEDSVNEPANHELPEAVIRRRQQIIDLAAERGARNVRIFGSVIDGTAGTDSDIDILVDLEPGRSLLDLGGLQMALQDLFDRPVDLKTPGMLREDIRDRIEDEAVPL